MREKVSNYSTEVPFTMLWANRSREGSFVDGEYDAKSQKWTGMDISAVETWSRSTTTGIINDDADEDKDD